MHLTDGDKARIVDLFPNNATCLRQRFPRDVYLRDFGQDWKFQFELDPFACASLATSLNHWRKQVVSRISEFDKVLWRGPKDLAPRD